MSAASERLAWEKKKYALENAKDRRGMFRGTNFIPKSQLDEERKRKGLERDMKQTQVNALELQKLTQAGNLAGIERAELGATKRTGMTEAGLSNRLGSELTQQQRQFTSNLDYLKRGQKSNEFDSFFDTDEYGESTLNPAKVAGLRAYLNQGQNVGILDRIPVPGGEGTPKTKKLTPEMLAKKKADREKKILQGFKVREKARSTPRPKLFSIFKETGKFLNKRRVPTTI